MARKKGKPPGGDLLASNRAAGHQYHLLKRFEAGLVLSGPEVKSARRGQVQLKEAYARVRDGEVWLYQAHFSPYTHARLAEIDPVRPRKLLLHAAEIRRLEKETTSGGVTLVPTRLYLKKGRIKIEIALARGKKLHDKRESSRAREIEREMARARGSRTR